MQEGWTVESGESNSKFEDSNLDEPFFEYDEEAQCPVEITEIESKIS